MKSKASKTKKWAFKGFENLNFNSDERDVITVWLETFKPDLVDSVAVLTEGGYKVSVSYSEHHDAYQISATCKLSGSPYSGYCFTLIHADVGKGLGVLRYVYDSLLEPGLYKLDESGGKHDW